MPCQRRVGAAPIGEVPPVATMTSTKEQMEGVCEMRSQWVWSGRDIIGGDGTIGRHCDATDRGSTIGCGQDVADGDSTTGAVAHTGGRVRDRRVEGEASEVSLTGMVMDRCLYPCHRPLPPSERWYPRRCYYRGSRWCLGPARGPPWL
jgi:hypothetical protein